MSAASPTLAVRCRRLRCLGVSLLTTALDAGLFALCLLTLAGRTLLVARWVCGAVGAVANFALNRGWTFDAGRAGTGRRQLCRYALTAAAAVTLATAIWWLLGLCCGWDPRLLHLLSMALVWVGFTYPLLRRWVFVAQ